MFVAIVIGLVGYLFFLSGDSFLAAFAFIILILYMVASGPTGSGSSSKSNSEDSAMSSSERAGDNSKVDKFAERTGDMVNSLGQFFGHLFTWAFKGEKKVSKVTEDAHVDEWEPEMKIRGNTVFRAKH